MFDFPGVKLRSIWINQRHPKVDYDAGCISPDLYARVAYFLCAAVDFKLHKPLPKLRIAIDGLMVDSISHKIGNNKIHLKAF